MGELRFAVRRRRVGDGQQMMSWSKDRAITFAPGKRSQRNAIDVDGQALVITKVRASKDGQSTIAHQFSAVQSGVRKITEAGGESTPIVPTGSADARKAIQFVRPVDVIQ